MSDISDLQIQEGDYTGVDVASVPDVLTGTPAENKAVFDNLTKALIAPRFNALLALLGGTDGASQIGVGLINGLDAATVQDAIAGVKSAIDDYIASIAAQGGAAWVGAVDPVNTSGVFQTTVQDALFNLRGLFDSIQQSLGDMGGADSIGISPITDIDATTVQDALAALQQYVLDKIAEAALGGDITVSAQNVEYSTTSLPGVANVKGALDSIIPTALTAGTQAASAAKLIGTGSAALPFALWVDGTQTVSVSGVTATSILIVAPDASSHDAYAAAGVRATGQAMGSIVFGCDSAPESDLTVNVLILGVMA
jgi:hypothetical protein